ncbi:MAG TPA: PPK2 family polyphosphate kinase [Mycobacteriales bacterium]|jgi:PPK2 family polyphosphate:nucleotide phosphotransferase|nr:PPK2 family polyphosphate kinase [Mycobacteriales bacterium]
MASSPVSKLLRAPTDGFALSGVDAGGTPGVKSKKTARAETEAIAEPLFGLQERLYAERERSVLIVLQGMDTSGKDGAVKRAVGSLNPAGVRITAFKAPTDAEKRLGFLGRIRRELPGPGEIAVFNRSHYEDVGIVRVHGWASPAVIERRYADINRFEEEVAKSGTTIIKCFLHISFEEQRERLLARLDDPAKHWKFNPKDLDERALWSDYMAAYEIAIDRCNTDRAPWYVVPADHKWYRDWALTNLLRETMDRLDPQYPKPRLNLRALRKRLGETA